MKIQKKRILPTLMVMALCVSLLLAGLPVSAATEVGGNCGKNVRWHLANGVITISGTGEMDNYNDMFPAPWDEYTELIQQVIVLDGVTKIGERAFYGLSSLKTVTLAASVKTIGALAFADCTDLKQITLPGVETLAWSCFNGCTSLVNITLPETLHSIADQVFYRCSKLSGITVPASVKEMGVMVFAYCKSLVYVKIKAPLAVLPNWTFYGCVKLWEVYLPSCIEVIETNALGECPSLYYVDYGGSEEVRQEIKDQLDQPTTMKPDAETSSNITFTETPNATITTTTQHNAGNSQWGNGSSGTVIDATIANPDGWSDVVDQVHDTISVGKIPDVVVQVQDNLTMQDGVLADLAGNDVTVTIQTSQNISWEIVMKDQTSGSMSGDQDFSVSMEKNLVEAFSKLLQGATSYSIKLGYTSCYTTVQFPIGKDAARKTATLYRVNGDELIKLSSVLIDDEGLAAYRLAGTVAGAYIIAVDVPGISKDEVVIPKSLAAEYGIDYNDTTLMDAQGSKYILTGEIQNDLGFGIGTLTLIIIGVLVGSAVVVGIVMTIMNKKKMFVYPPDQNVKRRRP